jgi:hypothetical protein
MDTITIRDGSSNRYNIITAWISTAAADKVRRKVSNSREASNKQQRSQKGQGQ